MHIQIDPVSVDKRWHSDLVDVWFYIGGKSGIDKYLVIEVRDN